MYSGEGLHRKTACYVFIRAYVPSDDARNVFLGLIDVALVQSETFVFVHAEV